MSEDSEYVLKVFPCQKKLEQDEAFTNTLSIPNNVFDISTCSDFDPLSYFI